MELYFTKMQGTGNDFVVIDDLSAELELAPEQVRALCDRHTGIGADGLILVRPPLNAGSTAYMHYINADGSLAEMCGNGVRCFAKWLVDKGFVAVGEGETEGQFVADTRAGRRPIRFTVDAAGHLVQASVDMGEPVFAPEAIPTTLAATGTTSARIVIATPAVVETPLPTARGEARFTCVNMGNPHAVSFDIPAWNLTDAEFAALGAPLEADTALFPKGCNIEFAELEGEDVVRMRVFERGVGETLACGTGACATAAAAILTGRVERACTIHLRGGVLHIEWRDDKHLILTGAAATVFEGTITL